MWRRRLAMAAVTLAACALVAACGGEDETSVRGAPTLRTSPLPTVEPPSPTPPICKPDAPLELPASFPVDEVPVPPDFVVWEVKTEPHLVVSGSVSPPQDASQPPRGVVASAVISRLVERGWEARLARGTAQDYDVTAPDGRVLRFAVDEPLECPGQVRVLYELQWVTPG
jgi:hypothetical protein